MRTPRFASSPLLLAPFLLAALVAGPLFGPASTFLLLAQDTPTTPVPAPETPATEENQESPASGAETEVEVPVDADPDAGTEAAPDLPVSELPDLSSPPAARPADADSDSLAPSVNAGAADAGGGEAGANPGTEAPSDGEEAATTELALKDGRILKNYQIHSWNKTSLTIFHSTGAANVPAHVLPDHVVKAYRMDPKLSVVEQQANRTKRTEQAVAALQAMDERRALRKMPAVTIEGTVNTVGEGGVILQIDDPEKFAGKGYQRIGGMIYDKSGKPVPQYRGQIFGAVWVTGHPLQAVVVDGDLLRFQGRVSGRHQVQGKTYPSVRFEKASAP